MKSSKILCALALVLVAGHFFRAPALRYAADQVRRTGWPGKRVTTAEVRFPSGNLRIAGTLFTPSTLPGLYPAVIISHGGTRLGRRLALYTVAARKLAERGYIVLTFDFRGFGDSERPRRFETASDLDFVRDVSAAADYLATLPRVDSTRISAIGHSFGAGVVVAAALRDHRIGRAVSISPGRNTARRFFGPDATDPDYPSRRMSLDMNIDPVIPRALFDPHLKDYVAEAILDHAVHPPVLLVDGGEENEDDLAFLENVAARMTAPKGYVTIPGADHYFGTRQDQDGFPSTTDYDPHVMDELVDAIDSWLRNDG